jgi:hypothetical protein
MPPSFRRRPYPFGIPAGVLDRSRRGRSVAAASCCLPCSTAVVAHSGVIVATDRLHAPGTCTRSRTSPTATSSRSPLTSCLRSWRCCLCCLRSCLATAAEVQSYLSSSYQQHCLIHYQLSLSPAFPVTVAFSQPIVRGHLSVYPSASASF